MTSREYKQNYYKLHPEKWAEYRKAEKLARLNKMTAAELEKKIEAIQKRHIADGKNLEIFRARLAELQTDKPGS